MTNDKTPISSSEMQIADAQTPVAVVDSQGSVVQDCIKRRAADLLRGAAQTGTLGAAFGAMMSEMQDDSPANAGGGSIDSSESVSLQPTQPSTDAIPNVVIVEVPMMPQTPTSTVSTHISPVASAVQVSGEATETPRSLSKEQEVLSPVVANCMGDTGTAPTPSQAVQLVPQEQEQQELLQKARRPAETSCCFGFLHRNPN